MGYAVDWTPDARSQLATLWLRHVATRRAITAAQATIDRLLASNPLGNGVAVSEGLYAVIAHPLRVQYEISEADRAVTVVSIREAP
jgi:plasmid stabilization system protein ParE